MGFPLVIQEKISNSYLAMQIWHLLGESGLEIEIWQYLWIDDNLLGYSKLEVRDYRENRELKTTLKILVFPHPKKAKGKGEYLISNISDNHAS